MEKTNYKQALITGGSSGIGLSIVHELLAAGTQVAICGRRQSELDKVTEAYPNVLTVQADMSTTEGIATLQHFVTEHLPEMDLLVQNAGLSRGTKSVDERPTAEGITLEINTNFLGVALLTEALLPTLEATKGTLVYVTSGLAFAPRASMAVYSATKAAIHSLAVSHRYALGQRGVRVVELAPPVVNTPFQGDGPPNPSGITPERVATELMEALRSGENELKVGFAAHLHAQREAAFPMVNGL